MIAAVAVFWSSLAICLWIYFGYPMLLATLARLSPRPSQKSSIRPFLTFIIPAYNEERTIGAKIDNTLSLDYPVDRLEVLVVSNGSTDETAGIVKSYSDPRVRLIDLPSPGKIEALNEGARQATGEILVFGDSDFLLDEHSLVALARHFADPSVGGVCGSRKRGVQREGDATGDGEGMYAQWDRWQKIQESRIGSVFAADGLLYAIRKSLYVPVTNTAQADDIAISVQVPLQGYRLLFDENATAWENATIDAGSEFRRKIRVTGHSVSALLQLRSRLFTSGFYSLELLSHKLVRHLIPFFLISLFLSNIRLVRRAPIYLAAMMGQFALYLLALIGAALRERLIGKAKIFYIPFYFCFVNAAAFLGVLSLMRGRRTAAWSSRGKQRRRSDCGRMP
jgi:cellulose synthase/poly-beta-1,6-N-acetylglucosamine synthase-like glycosyltransferase